MQNLNDFLTTIEQHKTTCFLIGVFIIYCCYFLGGNDKQK